MCRASPGQLQQHPNLVPRVAATKVWLKCCWSTILCGRFLKEAAGRWLQGDRWSGPAKGLWCMGRPSYTLRQVGLQSGAHTSLHWKLRTRSPFFKLSAVRPCCDGWGLSCCTVINRLPLTGIGTSVYRCAKAAPICRRKLHIGDARPNARVQTYSSPHKTQPNTARKATISR